jgi:hypothetical protein
VIGENAWWLFVESCDMRSGGLAKKLSLVVLLLLIAAAERAHASVALFVEEPYGIFGGVTPTGHSAIYLNHVCAAAPILLRRCTADETGVVISRYYKIGHYDWIAIPLFPYLYAVERAEDVPVWAEPDTVAQLRQNYAQANLENLISMPEVATSVTALPQLLGVSYIRKIYSFEVSTTDEEDDRLIAQYNDRENRSHFNLFTDNCADFVRHLVNFYFPGAAHRGVIADLAITTPKHIAKGLASYAHRHPELGFFEFIIPQIPGSYSRSHKPRGIVESLLTSKKYAVPITVLHPFFMVGLVVTYLSTGRFNVANNAPVIAVIDQTSTLVTGRPGARATPSPETARGTTADSTDSDRNCQGKNSMTAAVDLLPSLR